MEDVLHYKASPTCSQFHKDKSFLRLIQGPLGSGKTVAGIMDIFLKAIHAPVSPYNNTRYTRICVVRNTSREIRDTTLRSYNGWIDSKDPSMGVWREMDMIHHMRFTLPDNTKVSCDVLFRGLDTPKDIKKLFSLELTWIFFNELRFIDEEVFTTACTRTGRYPSVTITKRKLIKGEEYGVFADTNPPDTDHWLHTLFEEKSVEDAKVFHQPSGRSPEAENLDNLPQDYYKTISIGKDPEWIKVFIDGKYGLIKTGLPIYPSFNPELHIDHSYNDKESGDLRVLNYQPSKRYPILIGIDFGRTPAASFSQYDPDLDTYFVFDELVTFNIGATVFGELLKHKIDQLYPSSLYEFNIVGDPAGLSMPETDDQTPFDCLFLSGISADPADTQDPEIRKDCLTFLLCTLSPLTGRPKLQFPSPKSTPTIIKGLAGGYQNRRMQVTDPSGPIYTSRPLKNKYSHAVEALEYSLSSQSINVFDRIISSGAVNTKVDYSLLNRSVV